MTSDIYKLENVLARCEAIRAKYPNDPFGDHWECYGVPICDGVWGDPQYMGMRGEMEHMARATIRTNKLKG